MNALRQQYIDAGALRPGKRGPLPVIHVPARYPRLRLDAAGAGHAYVRVRRARRL